jgi:hypothetical protein
MKDVANRYKEQSALGCITEPPVRGVRKSERTAATFPLANDHIFYRTSENDLADLLPLADGFFHSEYSHDLVTRHGHRIPH